MSKRMSTMEFIEKAIKIHDNKYDYSKVTYTNCMSKVCIICSIHGEFWQTPNKHLLGQGCPECAKKINREKHLKTLEYYIPLMLKKHNDKYSYNNAIYKGYKEKISITCPIHGDFYQTIDNHLEGKGCPLCNSSHLENEIRAFLTEKNIEFEEQKKFDWLGRQSLDFYLPQYNSAIECQGKQHFGFGGWASNFDFKAIQELDERKRILCKENNIKLFYYSNLGIEYPYQVYENKEELLGVISPLDNI